ncbi:MATE family efflux transporter [Algibacter lectus]|uniref:MATE family efflux transporter n=1 Tax=Algibacter lectus TaxID=221126 RepID=UPI0026EED65C|nr:MATE family efflux transporter [Algibacter lectus]MDO7138870.1 MATE family efflux transporter [Algibacter lectus]
MQETKQAANRVAKNTGILYVQMGLTIFLSLYATRLILAALGAEDFGIFNVVGGAIAMLTFLNTAMSAASQRFMSFAQGEGNFNKQKQIFNISLILHFFIAITIVILLEIMGYFLFDGILKISPDRLNVATMIYQFLIISTFFTIISVPYDAIINSHENMLLVAILRIVEITLKLGIAIFITYTSFDKLYVFGLLMASLTVFLLIIRQIYCHKKYKEVTINFKAYYDKALFKEMTSFAGWSFLGSAASMITMQGMTVLINSFFGVIVNAAQGIALQITGQIMAFSNTMLKALNPLIVKSEGEDNRDRMLKASITGNKISFFLLAFFAIPLIIEMPYVLDLWLKDVPKYAVIFCQLNIFRSMVSQLTITFPTAIGATGNIKKSQLVESIIWILLLPVSYIMFKSGTAPETIYINLIFMVIGFSISRIYFTHRICGLSIKKYFEDVLLRALIVALVTAAVAISPILLMSEGFARLIIVCLVSSIVFLILILTVGLNISEKTLIINMGKTVFTKIIKRS